MIHLALAVLLALPPATDSVDAVLTRYYAAVGGVDRILAVHSRRMSGHYQEGSFQALTTILHERPALRRVSVVAPDGFAYVEIFDGRDEWEYGDRFSRPVQHDTGAAERAGRRGAEFDESFVNASAKGHHVEFIGSTVINDKPARELRVTLADGWAKEYYFDAATGLLVALRKAMPLHARGADIESLTYYGDYRSVNGTLTPFRFEERNVKTGATMNILAWDTIEVNVEIRGEAFRPPG